jgi:hypothetical protein
MSAGSSYCLVRMCWLLGFVPKLLPYPRCFVTHRIMAQHHSRSKRASSLGMASFIALCVGHGMAPRHVLYVWFFHTCVHTSVLHATGCVLLLAGQTRAWGCSALAALALHPLTPHPTTIVKWAHQGRHATCACARVAGLQSPPEIRHRWQIARCGGCGVQTHLCKALCTGCASGAVAGMTNPWRGQCTRIEVWRVAS